MTKWILLPLILGFFLQTACMQKEDSLTTLKKEIQNTLAIDHAHFGIAYKDLQTGKMVLLHEKDNFHAASTMKTPVLVELFKQAATGKFSLTDSIVIKNSFRSIVDGRDAIF